MQPGDIGARRPQNCYSALTTPGFRGKANVVQGNDGLSQMKPIKHALWIALLLSACGGNPFLPDVVDPGNGPPGTVGTPKATAKSPIKRSEVKVTDGGKYNGNGFAEGFVINEGDPADPLDDTFAVDGLAFDGANVYNRGTNVSEIVVNDGQFQVYEAANIVIDPVSGVEIDQYPYRALSGVSADGTTRFGVVRTGAYAGYGFGGFIYQRSGAWTKQAIDPATGLRGQATFSGGYGAIRDFSGKGSGLVGGLEYSKGDMILSIDFDDFNDGDGVEGRVFNREVFDIDGNPVTDDLIAAINDELNLVFDPANPLAIIDAEVLSLPELVFSVGPSTLATGEVSNGITSGYTKGGARVIYEAGKYYALIADSKDPQTGVKTDSGQVVGIIVAEGKDLRFDGVTVRETGGYIVYRLPPP